MKSEKNNKFIFIQKIQKKEGDDSNNVNYDFSSLFESKERSFEASIETLQDICDYSIKNLNSLILCEKSDMQDIQLRIEEINKESEQVNLMFFGKDWKFYIEKLKNKIKKHEKKISIYYHYIDIVQDNMDTDSFDIACELIDFYFKFAFKVPVESRNRIIVGETAIYKLDNNNICLLQRYTPSFKK